MTRSFSHEAGDPRPVLITGGAGFIGSNIAHRIAKEGHKVIIYDSLARAGVSSNLTWLQRLHPTQITHVKGDIRDETLLGDVVKDAKAVFHMAAQVAVTTSLTAPREDFEINLRGTLQLLEALRRKGEPTPLLFASTNKVYGGLDHLHFVVENDRYNPEDPWLRANGIGEGQPLDFHTPYGCSKGAADQYVLDYARNYGMPNAVMRMSCIYGERQMGTEDQGWVAHFLISALEGRPITLYGNGLQVRDILNVSDAVDAYLMGWRRINEIKGRPFNLGGGCENAVSLLQLLGHIEGLLQRKIDVSFADTRAGDQCYFVADTHAAKAALDFHAKIPWKKGVADLAEWLAENRADTLCEIAGAAE